MVSRYATCGLPTFASTLNSRSEPVDDDLEVELAHAGDDRLAGLLVGVHAEGRVFFGELLQRRR